MTSTTEIPTAAVGLDLVRATRTLGQIETLEGIMLEMPQLDIPVTHRFCEGVYIREITLPKDTCAIGHAHSKDCLNIVLTGSVSVLVNGELKRITAPSVFVGKALDRKIGYVHEASTWQTVHATSATDLAKLEEEFLVKSPTFLAHQRRLDADRVDYQLAVAELGFTQDEVQRMSEDTGDLLDLNCGDVFTAQSSRHGLGLFARRIFIPGDKIAVARIDGCRTAAGRYTNHSANPNANMQPAGLDAVCMVASTTIPAGCEILVNYRQASSVAIRLTKELSCQQ